MNFTLSINAKSNAENISKAVELIKSYGMENYSRDKRTIIIESSELDHKFRSILTLVKNVKHTKLELDSRVITNIDTLLQVNRCPKKRYCNGLCTLVDDYDLFLKQTDILSHPKNEFYNEHRWELYAHGDVIKEFTTKLLIIDRDLFLQYYLDDHYVVKKMCDVYSESAVTQAFNAKPKEIKIALDEFDYDEMLDGLEESENEEDFINIETVHLSKESIVALADEVEKRMMKFVGNKKE